MNRAQRRLLLLQYAFLGKLKKGHDELEKYIILKTTYLNGFFKNKGYI